ncbi:ATPase inhibitor B mitochondrial [Biomphalaria pfeifferi]|uniref:ATPase inhibitor B mitochondrial n=1 Tax=Biomphalaria pfeifferi TaxID=112525 RepID=A0AAD8FID6_BIOPF|nr:ATPase inhibitor B mitochondrial [Biomphalaria pfeifferi]
MFHILRRLRPCVLKVKPAKSFQWISGHALPRDTIIPPTTNYSGKAGDGEGKGGGGGGAIRSAGGAFGKREATQEEKYFYEEEQRQIKEMKTKLTEMYRKQLSERESKISSLKRDLKDVQDTSCRHDMEEEIRVLEQEVKTLQKKIAEQD